MSLARDIWRGEMFRMCEPVLRQLSRGELRSSMPFRHKATGWERMAKGTYNEAFGRTLCGVSGWLSLPSTPDVEGMKRGEWQEMSRQAIANAVSPESPDYLLDKEEPLSKSPQFLVDVAFFAQALLRAPDELFHKQPSSVQERIVDYLKAVRVIRPHECNWLLFSAMCEAALRHFTGECNLESVDYAFKRHSEWFKGDGLYGDGPRFAFDYYNSYVIQPMIVDIMREWGDESVPGATFSRVNGLRRAKRYAAIQERLIMPDGAFPVVGRSMCYRCGAFHHLANMAFRNMLPEDVTPAQVRCGLTAVICKSLGYAGTYDADGWLNIGICGSQPDAGEAYISTGSLYLASTVFLPLGLPETDEFWSGADVGWTQKRCWEGEEEFKGDHAVQDLA